MVSRHIFLNENFTMSQESCSTGWIMPYSHFHNFYEIYILESGERIVTVDGNDYTTLDHDAILFDKNILHTSKGTTPFSGICIHFIDRFLDFYFTQEAKQQLLECFKHKLIHLSDKDFETIKNIANNFTLNATDNFIELANILNILNKSLSRHLTYVPSGKIEPLTKSEQLINYVNNNYIFITNISDLINLFDISESYIFKIFKQTYNVAPKLYINRLKLKNACHCLGNLELSIKSVAFNCGFDCYEHFIRLFKKEYGLTPSQYRKGKKNNQL